jgi:hypothetical protein
LVLGSSVELHNIDFNSLHFLHSVLYVGSFYANTIWICLQMTKDEVLTEALECMEAAIKSGDWKVDGACDPTMTIERMKRALEAKDEPVATKNNDGITLHVGWDDLPVGTKLYTVSPQRKWVKLTEEELKPICDEWRIVYGAWMKDFARDIEIKLKEKNS